MTALVLFLVEAPLRGVSAPAEDAVPELGAQTAQSLGEARGALQELYSNFLTVTPKIVIAIAILVIFWMLFRLFKLIYGRIRFNPQSQAGVLALAKLFFLFVGILVAMTVLAGDIRALLGSVGLIGLALSWALQQPIESFAGYILNAFRAYYRLGDRIRVGEVYGDVYRIDILTTTVWEVGGPGKTVTGSQPTGALTTFPNAEVLRANIINYSRDFPFIWDEVTIGVANQSDLPYTVTVLKNLTNEIIGESMRESAQQYRGLLKLRGLGYDIEDAPQVYLSATDSWTNCTIRYLVDLRKRRAWSSLIYERISSELSKDVHKEKIISAYPKSIVVVEAKST